MYLQYETKVQQPSFSMLCLQGLCVLSTATVVSDLLDIIVLGDKVVSNNSIHKSTIFYWLCRHYQYTYYTITSTSN